MSASLGPDSTWVLQVFALSFTVWSALTAFAVLLFARIWLWHALPSVQRVRLSSMVAFVLRTVSAEGL